MIGLSLLTIFVSGSLAQGLGINAKKVNVGFALGLQAEGREQARKAWMANLRKTALEIVHRLDDKVKILTINIGGEQYFVSEAYFSHGYRCAVEMEDLCEKVSQISAAYLEKHKKLFELTFSIWRPNARKKGIISIEEKSVKSELEKLNVVFGSLERKYLNRSENISPIGLDKASDLIKQLQALEEGLKSSETFQDFEEINSIVGETNDRIKKHRLQFMELQTMLSRYQVARWHYNGYCMLIDKIMIVDKLTVPTFKDLCASIEVSKTDLWSNREEVIRKKCAEIAEGYSVLQEDVLLNIQFRGVGERGSSRGSRRSAGSEISLMEAHPVSDDE